MNKLLLLTLCTHISLFSMEKPSLPITESSQPTNLEILKSKNEEAIKECTEKTEEKFQPFAKEMYELHCLSQQLYRVLDLPPK